MPKSRNLGQHMARGTVLGHAHKSARAFGYFLMLVLEGDTSWLPTQMYTPRRYQ